MYRPTAKRNSARGCCALLRAASPRGTAPPSNQRSLRAVTAGSGFLQVLSGLADDIFESVAGRPPKSGGDSEEQWQAEPPAPPILKLLSSFW